MPSKEGLGESFSQSPLTKEFQSPGNRSALMFLMGGVTLVQMRDGFQSAAPEALGHLCSSVSASTGGNCTDLNRRRWRLGAGWSHAGSHKSDSGRS